jgi:tetratricopeptide (TPR) repeat protein
LLTWPLTGGSARILATAYTPDGKTLLTASTDGTLARWEADTGRPLDVRTLELRSVSAAAFSSDARLLLLGGSADHTARLWDVATGQALSQPLPHHDLIRSAAISPDARVLLTGCDDGTAQLWDATTGQPLGLTLPHQGPVRAVTFSPDGRVILTGSDDRTARFWAAATGRPLGLPLPHQAEVWGVAISPDGRTALTGSQDRAARVWTVPIPAEGEPERVLLAVQVHTGLEFDEHGTVRPLSAEAWAERRRQLEDQGGSPFTPRFSLADWHDHEAEEGEQTGHWFMARWHLDRLIADAPDDAALRTRRARVATALNDWPTVVVDYSRVIDLHADDGSTWLSRARAQERVAQWDEAFRDYNRAVELLPNNLGALGERGYLHAWFSRWQLAAADYNRATALIPNDPEFACQAAPVFLMAWDEEAYRRACTRAIELFGKTKEPRTAFLAARVCVLGPNAIAEGAEPVRLAEQAVAAEPRNSWYLHVLGLAHYRAGQLEKARQRLQESLNADPNAPIRVLSWLVLAMVHQRLGRPEEARQWLAKAVQAIDAAQKTRPAGEVGGFLPHPHDWLACLVLRREAEMLVANN